MTRRPQLFGKSAKAVEVEMDQAHTGLGGSFSGSRQAERFRSLIEFLQERVGLGQVSQHNGVLSVCLAGTA